MWALELSAHPKTSRVAATRALAARARASLRGWQGLQNPLLSCDTAGGTGGQKVLEAQPACVNLFQRATFFEQCRCGGEWAQEEVPLLQVWAATMLEEQEAEMTPSTP